MKLMKARYAVWRETGEMKNEVTACDVSIVANCKERNYLFITCK